MLFDRLVIGQVRTATRPPPCGAEACGEHRQDARAGSVGAEIWGGEAGYFLFAERGKYVGRTGMNTTPSDPAGFTQDRCGPRPDAPLRDGAWPVRHHVNAVAAGFILTDMARKSGEEGSGRNGRRRSARWRCWGTSVMRKTSPMPSVLAIDGGRMDYLAP
jgi:hypothetical protein